MSNQTQPKVDFGYYAVVPRIVRTHYKDLTAGQKWLYVCLRDLCGDRGTCYRTLQSLSDETGLSVGTLSDAIPELQKAGLIHAEKKRRKEGGKPVWHITIVDLWQANGEAHPTKRSTNESSSQENIQKPNENIHFLNEVSQEYSENENEYSNFVDRRNNKRTNKEEGLTRERDDPAVASPSQESSLSPASPALTDSSASKPDVPSSQDVAPGWNAIACRDRFYALSGIRPRLPKQLDEDAALAAQVYQTTSEIECTTAYTNMKADPYWKLKNFSSNRPTTWVTHVVTTRCNKTASSGRFLWLHKPIARSAKASFLAMNAVSMCHPCRGSVCFSFNTFVKHLPEYLHAPAAQEKSNGNTPPSKRSLGGPASEKPTAADNERNKQALLAKYAARQATASQQRQTA